MGKNQKKTIRSPLLFDFFGESIGFNIKGQSKHKSFIGMLISIGIFCTVTAFAVKKFLVMKSYEDTHHQSTIHENAIGGNKDDKVSMENFGIGVLTQNTFDGTHVGISNGFEWEIFSVDYSFGADN